MNDEIVLCLAHVATRLDQTYRHNYFDCVGDSAHDCVRHANIKLQNTKRLCGRINLSRALNEIQRLINEK